MSVRHRSSRFLVFAVSVALVCTLVATSAFAQRWDKKTTVTFNAPVEIPGVNAQVLPAGTYVFKLLDSLADRHIVQVFNKEENHIYATILAIPNYRLKATDKTVMTFSERATGDPQAIRAWFYPGDNSGQEFVYPKKRAVELARITNQPILFLPDEIAPNIVAPVKTAVEPPVIALKEAPVMAINPRGETLPLEEVVVTPPVQTAGLPKTASELPLLALAGFLSLLAALSLKPLWDR